MFRSATHTMSDNMCQSKHVEARTNVIGATMFKNPREGKGDSLIRASFLRYEVEKALRAVDSL